MRPLCLGAMRSQRACRGVRAGVCVLFLCICARVVLCAPKSQTRSSSCSPSAEAAAPANVGTAAHKQTNKRVYAASQAASALNAETGKGNSARSALATGGGTHLGR